MNHQIAVVDDDAEMLELLGFVLGRAGYKVSRYATPGRFFDGVLRARPDLCIIDVQLPGMDGREVIRVLRANPDTAKIPLIAMTSVAVSSSDVVRGLDNGADEYFSKPLDMDLLLVRIKNLIERRGGGAEPKEILRWADLEVIVDERRVCLQEKEIALTHLEFQLLLAFLRQPNRVLPRSWILDTVWNSSGHGASRTVDKHVENLRKKIPPLARQLETVVKVGYIFRP